MPFAVAHDGANSEISACNYPARAQGVHAMLSVKQARKRCPQLQVEGYHFGDIAAISRKIYEIFCEDAPVVAAISCDEAYLELPEGTDPLAAASHIRKRIYEATKCPVSAGAGSSMMFARIATSEAKPNGQVMLDERAAQILLRELPVRHLPGIGYHRGRKLKFYGFKTCADIQNSTCAKMRSILGDKLGDITFNYACGRDCRPVVTKEGKASVSVSVNYGVDLPDSDAADEFLQDLVQQVVKRLKLIHIDTKTRKVTLQLMKAQEGAGEPLKKKGHGLCDRFSPSMTLSESTQSIGPILAAARTLLAKFDCHPRKIKGLGVVLSELVSSTSGSPIACRRSAHAPVPGELNSAALMKAFIAGGQGSPRLAHVMKTRRHSNSIALGRVLPPQPFHAIRPLLISYLQGISSPSPQHIGFLYEYLASLLDEQRVSEVCACLRTITRIWVGHGNKQADQAAAQLLAKVQETSRALTGCELIVL
jgi:nucleotidyltransferase/DNA polymerase involved in DNA repair